MAAGTGHEQTSHANSADRGVFSLRAFVHDEAFGGILLLACAIVALVWANSPWKDRYEEFWHTSLTLGTSHFNLTESLLHWVNDGLMAIFFFVVGLEIKREVLTGELASPRRAAFPAIAALGGVLVPAAIYVAVNAGGPGETGWGIPMATDIAFALGVLALLGDRVPVGLKVFLTALAIVDDILAVLVIALIYTSSVDWGALGLAGVVLLALVVANRIGLRQPFVYGVLGIVLWAQVFESGVHATVAGILLALTIPAGTKVDPAAFVAKSRRILDRFDEAGPDQENVLANSTRQESLAELDELVERAGAPLHRLEHALHPWVAYAIVPVFALANAGVRISGDSGHIATDRITLGVVLGLVLGKPVGIGLAAWLAVRSGVTELPEGVTWPQAFAAGLLGGIGFTMSLFVADLAFGDPGESSRLAAAKLGILAASVIAGGAGWLVLRGLIARDGPPHPSPESAR
jgi:NhaA family Na+:H+ antiporter